MKCLDKTRTILFSFVLAFILVGCGKENVDIPYGMLDANSSYSFDDAATSTAVPLFAEDLCAISHDVTNTSNINTTAIYAAAFYDINAEEVLYSYNATERINPASLTKLMTALLVFENLNLDDTMTIQDVSINEEGAQLFKLKEGDKITVRNLLYVTLVYSGNDAALAFAKEISGSQEAFADLMNERARQLGCTGTHFVNPNGLTHEDHYTTVYDLYLIFNELLKYDEFLTIVNTVSTEIGYNSADGEYITKTITNTNKYLIGDYNFPNSLTVVGGKTGTTNAAGKCIIIYSLDGYGNPYISVIMGAGDEPTLYQMMNNLCNDIIG